MIGKGPGWWHSFCLIEPFSDLTNFLKINSAELAQNKKIVWLLTPFPYL
jgi:hypothetical protein